MNNHRRAVVLIFVILLAPLRLNAYSILTHEQLIDLLWSDDIVPLLQARFRDARPEDIRLARKYAYGGALLADAGYYPRGQPYTANLTHYVRSGDFVTNLFRNATDVYEFAFAIGALTHYTGDIIGHSTATNPAVAIMFHDLVKPGSIQPDRDGHPQEFVSYEDGESQHKQVEVGFDVNSLNHNRFIAKKVRNRFGLDVPLQQLTYAFYQTYGLKQDFVFKGSDVNLHAYASKAQGIITDGIYGIAKNNKYGSPDEASIPEIAQLQSLIAGANAEEDWRKYKKDGSIQADLISVVLKIDPYVPVAQVRMPTTATQRLYVLSVLQTIGLLRQMLKTPVIADERFVPQWPASATTTAAALPNYNLDTGRVEKPRSYKYTDDAYVDLLQRVVSDPTWPVHPALKADIQRYFADSNPTPPYDGLDSLAAQQTVVRELEILRNMPETTGCPDHSRKFGNTDVHWYDPNPAHHKPDYQSIPALCDSAAGGQATTAMTSQ